MMRGNCKKIQLVRNIYKLNKRAPGVEATIYTGKISKQLQLDIDKHNRRCFSRWRARKSRKNVLDPLSAKGTVHGFATKLWTVLT